MLWNSLRKTLLMVAIASMIIAFFWEHFFLTPTLARIFFSGLMLCAIVVFPYKLFVFNDFDKLSNTVIHVMFVLSVIAILRSVLSDDPSLYANGNKWLTLFGNEMCTMIFFPPFFAYFSSLPQSLNLLKKINYQYLFWGTFCILWFKMPLASLVIFLSVFFPYVKGKYKILIGIAYFQALLSATLGNNPARANFLLFGFGVIAYILVFCVKKVFLTKIFCVTCFALPLLLFVPILSVSRVNEQSFFENIQNYIIDNYDNSALATDTRSFLYREMAWDLTKTDSWILGKGAFALYYSEWFDEGMNGRFGRIASEVCFLNLLMHGGLSYVFFYFFLFIYAAYKGLWKSRNRFVQCLAVAISGWYFCCFVGGGELVGCRYSHMMFFMLLGCCLSNRFLNMTDDEIVLLFNDENVV